MSRTGPDSILFNGIIWAQFQVLAERSSILTFKCKFLFRTECVFHLHSHLSAWVFSDFRTLSEPIFNLEFQSQAQYQLLPYAFIIRKYMNNYN